ncbi:MAG: hypothetical protein AAGJ50_14300, partial [Pseudomonadota bacterium]
RWLSSATQWGNQQHYEKVRRLRAYNLTRPEAERLRYFGVDLISEDERSDAAAWLANLMENLPDTAPADLLALREASAAFDPETFPAIAERALTSLATDGGSTDGLETLNLAAVQHLTKNMLMSLQGAGRYDAIPSNITAMVEEFGIGDDEPLYGFWGLFHAMKAVVNETGRPLALRLAEAGLPFSDRIVTFSMVYADSDQNMPSRILPSALQDEGPFTELPMGQNNPYLMYLYGIGDLRAVAGGAPVSIFSLYNEGSPYIGKTRLRTQTGLLTQVFKFEITPPEQQPSDYVILVEGSPALTAWTGE